MAVSSGYAIGSCNWIIQSDYEKVMGSVLLCFIRKCKKSEAKYEYRYYSVHVALSRISYPIFESTGGILVTAIFQITY